MRALLVLLLAAAVAQEPDPTGSPPPPATLPGVEAGARPAPDQVDALARDVASGLRCPVCQGLSVADSTSAAATQMHGRIRDLVAAGYSRQQIEDYFVSKYGEWVLLEPRPSGMNVVVWVAPVAGLAFAGAIAAALSRRRGVQDRDPDTVVDETAGGALPPDDPHAMALLAEVDDE